MNLKFLKLTSLFVVLLAPLCGANAVEFDEDSPLITKARTVNGGLGLAQLEENVVHIEGLLEQAKIGSLMKMKALLDSVVSEIQELSAAVTEDPELTEQANELGRKFVSMRDSDLPEIMYGRAWTELSRDAYDRVNYTLSFLLDDFQSMQAEEPQLAE